MSPEVTKTCWVKCVHLAAPPARESTPTQEIAMKNRDKQPTPKREEHRARKNTKGSGNAVGTRLPPLRPIRLASPRTHTSNSANPIALVVRSQPPEPVMPPEPQITDPNPIPALILAGQRWKDAGKN